MYVLDVSIFLFRTENKEVLIMKRQWLAHLKIFGIGLLFTGIVSGLAYGIAYLLLHTTIGIYVFVGVLGAIGIYGIGYLINEFLEIRKHDTKSFM